MMIAGHLKFCDSPFWDRNLTLFSKYPDLTRCFQDSILFIMPCLYLLPTYPFYLWHLKKYGQTHIPYHISLLAILKIVLCVIITALGLVDIVLRVETLVRRPIVVSALLSPVLLFISYALMAFLQYYERKRGIWSSGYTFNFWILCTTYLTIAIWSNSVAASKHIGHDPRSKYYLGVYSSQLALVILQTILHSLNSKSRSGFDSNRCHFLKTRFGSKGNVKMMNERGTVEESLTLNNLAHKEETSKVCPEVYASFLSRITFSWFDKLAFYGSKHPLVRGDLWNLSERNASHKLAPLFAHTWSKHMNKLRERRDAKSNHDESRPEELLATLTPSETLLVDKLSNGLSTNVPEVVIKTVTGRTAYTHEKDGSTQAGPKSSNDKGLKPSLTYVLYSCFKSLIWQSVIYKFVNDMCTFLNPQLLHYIIAFIQAEQRQSIWVGIFYALAMLVSAIFHTFVLHQYFHVVFILGMRIKTILICAVYKKALRLSNSARRTSTVGEIVNLMSVDSQKIMDVCSYVSLLWSSPLQILVCMAFLWSILGPSVLAGFLVMVLLIPLNGIIANKIKKLQTQQMRYKDERIKVMNEVLNGIKVLKLYAWEPSFEQKVLDIRNKEIDILKKIAFLNAITSFVWSCAPFTVSCVTFGTYVLVSPENILDASKAFVSLSLFNILRFPLSMLPIILTYVVEARVAMKRLCTFFMLDELDPDSVTKAPLDLNDKNVEVIVVENGNFAWDASEPIDEASKLKKKRSGGRKRHLLHLKRHKKHGHEPAPLTRKNSCVAGKRGSKDDSFLPTSLPPLLTQSEKLWGSLPQLADARVDKSVLGLGDKQDFGRGHLKGHLQPDNGVDNQFSDPATSHETEVEIGDKEELNDAIPRFGTIDDDTKKENYRSLTLHNINLSVKRGQLVAVVGTVGSGKSSLVSALLGDMKRQGFETVTAHKGFGPSWSPVNTSGYSSLNAHSHYPACPKDANNPDPKPDKEPLISAATTDDLYSPGNAVHPPAGEIGGSRAVSKVMVRGQVGYVSQQPWIRNATLKDNVVFDAPFGDDVIEYEKVLRACALTQDRDYLLPDGDATEIGEKGVTLSGGQKQRLSLARAVYRRRLTDVYLLDDPLSAVDVHVGRHLFDNVLGPCGLLAQKTRVLVTNAIHILPNVDKIVVMKNGTIAEQGTYVELSSKMEGVFSELLKNYLASRLQSQTAEDPTSSTTPDAVSPLEGKISQTSLIHATTPQRLSRTNSKSKTSSSRSLNAGPTLTSGQVGATPALQVATSHESLAYARKGSSPATLTATLHPPTTPSQGVITKIVEEEDSSTELPSQTGKNGEPGLNKVVDKDGGQLMTHETTETGRVRFSVYLTYFKAIKYHILIIFLLLYLFYYALSVAANFWLSDWSDDKPIVVNGTTYQDIPLRNKRLQVYALYGGLQGAAIMASSIVIALSMVYASRTLHLKLLRNILHSPMVFFDTTPLGRIVNRFSKDIDTLDNSLPQNIRAWITTFYGVLSTIVVISFSTPLFFAGVVPMGIIYLFILKFYVPTSRQLKRLESVSRSPIFSHFQETLLGSSTIRAFGAADKFIAESHRLVDQNQMCYYPTIVSNRWLAVRLELIGSFIVFFSSLTVVLSRETIKPGLAGLAISYALSVTQALNWLVRMTCDLETNIVAVERVTEYSNTPVEAPWVIESRRPPDDWPAQGNVEFEHYWLRYRPDLEPSLKDVTFGIKGEDKVGVVGRTGAGKSSLTAALFRIVEPETGSGHDSRIVIDGVDIATLGLHDLRSRLTIIPQDPVLFSGSLRFNLDPFNKYTDQEVWESLNKAHLKNFVTSLPQSINYEIAESGENLSLGQRQLVCLARAMLRNSKILVLDEATAAVDLETDELIQQTIREKFSPCTVVTVAHRLNTVIDYTKILVLDHGRVAEYDTPLALLKNKKSKFYRMCHEAGLAFNTPMNNGSPSATAMPFNPSKTSPST